MINIFLFISAALSIAYFCEVVFLFNGLRRSTPRGFPANLTYSVVIAAHNEERVIENCLKSVLAQTIEKQRYEIILAADRCNDSTIEIARNFCKTFKNLFIIEIDDIPADVSPKKYALTRAIAKAKNKVIAVTDADCLIPKTWLATLDRYFNESTGVVQGITSYSYIEGMNRFLFNIQEIDFVSHGIISCAAIRAGMPINANANNLAFRKTAFEKAGGYSGIGGIISGDDDLLLQRIHRQRNYKIRYMSDPEAAVTTFACTSWKTLFEQRKRWGSKTVHYQLEQTTFLSIIFIFYCTIIINFAAGLVNMKMLLASAVMTAVKLTGESMLVFRGTRILGRRHVRRFLFIASLLHLPLVIVSVIFGVFGKFTWKGSKLSRHAAKRKNIN